MLLNMALAESRKVFLWYLPGGNKSRFELGTLQTRHSNIIYSTAKLVRSVCFVLNVIITHKLHYIFLFSHPCRRLKKICPASFYETC
jgi:hypothetical protein